MNRGVQSQILGFIRLLVNIGKILVIESKQNCSQCAMYDLSVIVINFII